MEPDRHHIDDDLDMDLMQRQLLSTTEACQKFMESLDSCILQRNRHETSMTHDLSQVAHLQQQVSVLEEQLATERLQHTEMSRSQQDHWDNLVVQYKLKIQHTEDEKLQVENERRRLNVELNKYQQRLQQAEDLISSLTSHPQKSSTADQERIQLLEAQLQVFREDFESERRDRQIAQNKVNELEKMFAARQVCLQPPQQYQIPAQHPESGWNDYRGQGGTFAQHPDPVRNEYRGQGGTFGASRVPAAGLMHVDSYQNEHRQHDSGGDREERTSSQSNSLKESTMPNDAQ